MTEQDFKRLAAAGFNRVPLVLETFADLDTPLSIYLKLANRTNTYLLEFVGIIKKLSKGLVKVTLKNEKGEPLQSVYDAVIDADTHKPGTQEVKEWMALVWYLQQQPDTNGNGIGIGAWNYAGHTMYECGIATMAVSASGAPDTLTTTGPVNVIGRTYRDVAQDMVDYLAFAQDEGGGRGGWHYSPNDSSSSDNSISGYVTLGLSYAEASPPYGLDLESIQNLQNFVIIINALADLHHLGKVLDETAVRPFWCLARADPAPLGRVQVTGLEVRL